MDRARIGMIGHSLGGQETLFTTAADTRIRAAASSCGFGSLRVLERDRILHNFALFVPGLAEPGDYGAVLALVAPRPFLVAARSEDPIFPMDGIEETVAAGRAAFTAAGAADRWHLLRAGPAPVLARHAQAAYEWLDRWLKPKRSSPHQRRRRPRETILHPREPDDGQEQQHAAHDPEAFSFGGCMPIAIRPAQPSTLTPASGRYQRPRLHGPIVVQSGRRRTQPSAVGRT